MRAFLLSLRGHYQVLAVLGLTIGAAFGMATISGKFFDMHQLAANTDLSSSVYQVLGSVYAILLTFTLWGVWQNFNIATSSVQAEAYAILDLVHNIEISPDWANCNIRDSALEYLQIVIDHEWSSEKKSACNFLLGNEESHLSSQRLMAVVQKITPQNPRDIAIFSQTLSLLNTWLDARRSRILQSRGDSAKTLWPLLITGALVLFAFHGLFVAKTLGIWISLLFGLSLVIGITFFLIFTLDCPFSGSLSIDSEPFKLAIHTLKFDFQRHKEAV